MALEILRLALATVFAVAGITKLLDPEGSRSALRRFGVPRRLVGPTALALPVAELAVAAGLLVASTARHAAVAASALLAAFAIAVAVARIRGRTPDCHCFGRLHSAPAGWSVVARNVGLAALAATIAVRPATPIGLTSLVAFALAALVVAQAGLWLVLLRRYGAALRRIDELEREAPIDLEPTLEVGDPAPGFALPSIAGGEATLAGLLARGRPVALVFTDQRCGACTALFPEIARWQQAHGDALTIAVAGHGDRTELAALAEEHGLDLELVLLADPGLLDAYAVRGTPSAILLGADGTVLSQLTYGSPDIELVIEEACMHGALRLVTHG